MYVCLCSGTTCQHVAAAIERGASTPKQIAAACGAGQDCGRCLRTLKATLERSRLERASLSASA